jgi:hypothetical protein
MTSAWLFLQGALLAAANPGVSSAPVPSHSGPSPGQPSSRGDTAPADAAEDAAARDVATRYLKALDGSGTEEARATLLGGLTLTAEEFTIPNWKIIGHEKKVEEKSLIGAVSAMKRLDQTGHEALTEIMNLGDEEEEVVAVSQEQAVQMMAPTRVAAKRFLAEVPVFAYCARAGKDVYWHPDNPWRKVVEKLSNDGAYQLTLHLYSIEEREAGRAPRIWPLRVLRLKTASFDSGYRVLPASDWDPDY